MIPSFTLTELCLLFLVLVVLEYWLEKKKFSKRFKCQCKRLFKRK